MIQSGGYVYCFLSFLVITIKWNSYILLLLLCIIVSMQATKVVFQTIEIIFISK